LLRELESDGTIRRPSHGSDGNSSDGKEVRIRNFTELRVGLGIYAKLSYLAKGYCTKSREGVNCR